MNTCTCVIINNYSFLYLLLNDFQIPLYCLSMLYFLVLINKVCISALAGGQSLADCMECTAGFYCQAYGLSAPSGPCDIGYYCPGGQDTPTPSLYACSPGHFCYEGSHNQTGCPSGDYQPHWGQGDCDTCPPGSYCKAFGKDECCHMMLG